MCLGDHTCANILAAITRPSNIYLCIKYTYVYIIICTCFVPNLQLNIICASCSCQSKFFNSISFLCIASLFSIHKNNYFFLNTFIELCFDLMLPKVNNILPDFSQYLLIPINIFRHILIDFDIFLSISTPF